MRRTLFLGSALLLAYCLLLAASQGDGVLGEECLAEDGTCPAPSLRKSSSNATSMLSQALGDEGAAWLAHVWPVVQPAGISGIVGYATGLLVRVSCGGAGSCVPAAGSATERVDIAGWGFWTNEKLAGLKASTQAGGR
eukprot:XP_001691595.1 predicted protein [Chlamydomonas reinhardtii]